MISTSVFAGFRCESGFTLIELLVSMAIGNMLIMGLTTVSSMITDTLSVSHHQHQPPSDESGDSVVDGLDFVNKTLAENATIFRVAHITPGSAAVVQVNLVPGLCQLQSAETVKLHSRVRVGRVW